MRGLFKRGGHGNACCDTGCDTGCNSCGAAPQGMIAPGATNGTGAGKAAEQIPAPKDGTPPAKMPDGKGGDAPPAKGQVEINVAPNAAVPAAAPAIENAPAVRPAAPAPEADNKEQRPF